MSATPRTTAGASPPGVVAMRAVYAAFVGYALFFAFAPTLARAFPFDMMFYRNGVPSALAVPEAKAALDFHGAVIGGVMAGWLSLSALLVWRDGPGDRRLVLWAVSIWFVVDSAASVAAGFPLNAATNVGFALVLIGALRLGGPFRPAR